MNHLGPWPGARGLGPGAQGPGPRGPGPRGEVVPWECIGPGEPLHWHNNALSAVGDPSPPSALQGRHDARAVWRVGVQPVSRTTGSTNTGHTFIGFMTASDIWIHGYIRVYIYIYMYMFDNPS